MTDWQMTGRRARFLAFALFMIALAETVAAAVGAVVIGMSWTDAVGSYLVTNSAMGVAFAACGALIAWHRPHNPFGWLLLGAGIAHLTTAAALPVGVFGGAHGWPLPALSTVLTIFGLAWPLGILTLLPLALLLFPDGRLLSPRWRPVAWLTVAAGAAYAIASASGGLQIRLGPGLVVRPLVSLAVARSAAVVQALNALTLAVSIAVVAALAVRYWRADERGRTQLWWLVLAMPAMIIVNWQRWTTGNGPILLLLAAPLIPAAITVAILRHGLFDIKLVISRTVLYGMLSAAVVGGYAGLVAVFGLVLRHGNAPYASAMVIALAFNPARAWLQRVINRVFYGSRRDPLRAVNQVGAKFARDDLTGVAESLRETLRLPFAAIRAGDRQLTASGTPPPATGLHGVPLTIGAERVGELVVGVRPGERRMSSADDRVLGALATPVAVAVRASVLAEALQATRAHLVAAREEERRRLHRELHDSLGPALTGAALTADAAGNLIVADPAKARLATSEVSAQVRSCIDDVRRLVYGLRPPSLDEAGLMGALRDAVDRLGGAVEVRIEAPAELPALPAAIEVAAYRIATEALTNIVRHARAGLATVRITADTHLRLSVTDDGLTGGTWRPGVGLASIAERAAEVGGSCHAGPTTAGGAVTAVLPLALPGPSPALAGVPA